VSANGVNAFVDREVSAYIEWLAAIPSTDVRPFIDWLNEHDGSPASYQREIGGERVRFDAFTAWLDERRLTFADFVRAQAERSPA